MGTMSETAQNSLAGVSRFGRVAVLCGGNSSEREVSLNSGAEVFAALQRSGVQVEMIDTAEISLSRIEQMHFDRVFIALHGPGGEDGTLQGALEMLGIPYTGSGVLSSALAMDKLRTKQLWRGIGLPTAAFSLLHADSNWAQELENLGGKVMVKPAKEGSSIGMRIAASAEELQAAWEQANSYDSEVIAEQWLSGEEFTVAILGDQVLPPIKLQTDNAFYDYQAKYQSSDTRYICPCGLDASREEQLKELAMQAFTSVGCSGWGRVDVMMDETQQFQLLEVNSVPGMTDHSLVPMAARAAGYSFEQLVVAILETSLLRDLA